MRRKNFTDTVMHRKPEHLLVDFGGCPLSFVEGDVISKLMNFLGFSEKTEQNYCIADTFAIPEKLLTHYDIDTRGIGNILAPRKSLATRIDENTYVDEWGITRKFTGLYWDIVENPLKGCSIDEIRNYPFPDPQTIDIHYLDELTARAKYLYENTDYVICASHPVYGVFELGCWMFGFDDFLCRMAAEPEDVHCFFERVLKYQLEVSEIYYSRIGKYIHYTSSGDDFATQRSTFFSVNMFNEMVFPYFKERISKTKQYTDAKFLHHSCGNVFSLIPSLIDAGVDILNPIQPCSKDMNPVNLRDTYRNRIVFHGGLDTQEILPKCSPEQVAEEVRKLIDVFKPEGNYIFAAAHNIQTDVSAENIDAMFTAAKKYK